VLRLPVLTSNAPLSTLIEPLSHSLEPVRVSWKPLDTSREFKPVASAEIPPMEKLPSTTGFWLNGREYWLGLLGSLGLSSVKSTVSVNTAVSPCPGTPCPGTSFSSQFQGLDHASREPLVC
jgi:hypothetical protein